MYVEDLAKHLDVECFYNELCRYLSLIIPGFQMVLQDYGECMVMVFHQLRVSVSSLSAGKPTVQYIHCTINKHSKNSARHYRYNIEYSRIIGIVRADIHSTHCLNHHKFYILH